MAYIKQIELPNGEVHTIYDEAAHNEINYIQQHLGQIKITVLSEREFETDYEPNPDERFANTIYYVESTDSPGTYTQYVCAESNGSWEWITISMDIDMSAYSKKNHYHQNTVTRSSFVNEGAYSSCTKNVLEQTEIIPIARGNGITVSRQTGSTSYQTVGSPVLKQIITDTAASGDDADKYIKDIATTTTNVHTGNFNAVTDVTKTTKNAPVFTNLPHSESYATGGIIPNAGSNGLFVTQLSFESVITAIDHPSTVVTGLETSSSNSDLLADVSVTNGVLSFNSKTIATDTITHQGRTGTLAQRGKLITKTGYIGDDYSSVVGNVAVTKASPTISLINAVNTINRQYFVYDDIIAGDSTLTIQVPELTNVNVPEAGEAVTVATGGLLALGEQGGGTVVTSLSKEYFVKGLTNGSTSVITNVNANTSVDINNQSIDPISH